MTIIVANATHQSQLLVADRLVTELSSAKTMDDEAYKILLYVNRRQSYTLGVGFAGMAEVNGKKTAQWLVATLPEIMDAATRIGLAIPALSDACTREVHFPREPMHLTLVMTGRFNNVPDNPKRGRWIPFLSIISNAIAEKGRQVDQLTRNFQAYSTRLLRKNQQITVCRGDLRPAIHRPADLRRLYRHLRQDRSPNAKVQLCAHYIRSVATRSKRVGGHVLGVAILPDGHCVGYDLPPEGRRLQRTMPHVVSESGSAATNITITEHPSR